MSPDSSDTAEVRKANLWRSATQAMQGPVDANKPISSVRVVLWVCEAELYVAGVLVETQQNEVVARDATVVSEVGVHGGADSEDVGEHDDATPGGDKLGAAGEHATLWMHEAAPKAAGALEDAELRQVGVCFVLQIGQADTEKVDPSDDAGRGVRERDAACTCRGPRA